MKPEIALALSKESDHAKKVLAEEVDKEWAKYRYVAAIGNTIIGIAILTKTILFIAQGKNIYIGGCMLFVSLFLTFMPWYFIARKEYYRKLKIISEALLTINEPPNKAG